jgi:hypothetical protein
VSHSIRLSTLLLASSVLCTKEDGWIKVLAGDETFEGVLEIRGVRGQHFGLRGLRQLSDWIERGISLHKKTYFGIFVGNSAIEDPP